MKKSKILFLIAGLILLVLLIKSFGVETTIEQVKKIGWPGFILICAIYIFTHVTLAYGWRVLVTYPVKKHSFHKFVLARIAGDATSSINALGSAAGEPLKAMYVKDILPLKIGLATVVLDRLIHLVSSVLMVLTGIFAGLFVFKSNFANNLAIFLSLLCLFIIMLALSFRFVKKHSDRMIYNILKKLPAKLTGRFLSEKNLERIKLIDDEIKYVFSSRDNLNHFYISLAMHYFGSIITCSLEIYIIVNYIVTTGGITLAEGLFVYVFGFIATSALFFVPANVGTSEGSYSIALSILGHDPVIGLSVGIIRRFRTFVWSGIGIILLFYAGLFRKENVESEKK
jgi:uncharacterized membrane protein YbhN (UPF0104 family)